MEVRPLIFNASNATPISDISDRKRGNFLPSTVTIKSININFDNLKYFINPSSKEFKNSFSKMTESKKNMNYVQIFAQIIGYLPNNLNNFTPKLLKDSSVTLYSTMVDR